MSMPPHCNDAFLELKSSVYSKHLFGSTGKLSVGFPVTFHMSSGGDSKSTCSGFLCQKMPHCGTSFFLNNLL